MVIKNVTESRTQCRIRIQGPLQSPRVRKDCAGRKSAKLVSSWQVSSSNQALKYDY